MKNFEFQIKYIYSSCQNRNGFLNVYVGCSNKPFLRFKFSIIFGNFRKYLCLGYYDCNCGNYTLEYDGNHIPFVHVTLPRFIMQPLIFIDVEHKDDMANIYEIRSMHLVINF
ncbi:unnamed protein product [Onchocerca flexuosa]|uniref:Uncharacterized protein n=1 Tax=Onchocerca flexuosa TaxID=387005 RepID=A0A3P7WZP3_9BILA|nr:unnamed protein product [Onchocerca flexuosa]